MRVGGLGIAGLEVPVLGRRFSRGEAAYDLGMVRALAPRYHRAVATPIAHRSGPNFLEPPKAEVRGILYRRSSQNIPSTHSGE